MIGVGLLKNLKVSLAETNNQVRAARKPFLQSARAPILHNGHEAIKLSVCLIGRLSLANDCINQALEDCCIGIVSRSRLPFRRAISASGNGSIAAVLASGCLLYTSDAADE